MTLDNKEELAIIKLRQIIDFTNKTDYIDYCDLPLIIEAQHEIKTLVQELVDCYSKLDYLKYGC